MLLQICVKASSAVYGSKKESKEENTTSYRLVRCLAIFVAGTVMKTCVHCSTLVVVVVAVSSWAPVQWGHGASHHGTLAIIMSYEL